MITRSCLLATVVAISLFSGQQPASDSNPETSIRISVNLVQVDATVTDARGNPVRDLKKSDFEILLDGKEQTLTAFSSIQNNTAEDSASSATRKVPSAVGRRIRPDEVSRTTVIFVDDLNMAAETVPFVRRGVHEAIEKTLDPTTLLHCES